MALKIVATIIYGVCELLVAIGLFYDMFKGKELSLNGAFWLVAFAIGIAAIWA